MADMPPGKVKPVQEMLNKIVKPQPELKVDGVLGKNTAAALKEFQAKAGLKQTGEIDAETAPVIARAIKTGKIEKDQPTVFVDLGGGKYAGFTEKEWEAQKKRAADSLLRGPVREMKGKVDEAEMTWDHFREMNSDQYIVSFLVELTRGTELPSKSLIGKARAAADEMEKLAKAQDFQGFSRRAPAAAKEVNDALDAMRTYRSEMIDGAGNWVTGLEATKWTAFTALSVYFAPAVAAQLGASAVAGAVVGGAAVKGVESAAGEIGNWSAGTVQGGAGGALSRVMVDTLVGAVTGWLSKGAGGKAVGEAIMTKISAGVAAKLAVGGTSQKVVEAATKYFLNEGAKKVLEGAVADAGKALKGDPKMTIAAFAENVGSNFVKGLAFGPFNQAFKKFTEGKNVPMPTGADAKKLKEGVEKIVLKKLGDDNIHIKVFEKAYKEAMDKLGSDILGKAMAKGFEKAAVGLFEKAKGAMSQADVEAELQKDLMTPAVLDECRDALAEQIAKDLKKGKR
jgi:peptidoglycan hydrolase-like protein with peptidoglycan-binding domain